jgi:hypothetical protein
MYVGASVGSRYFQGTKNDTEESFWLGRKYTETKHVNESTKIIVLQLVKTYYEILFTTMLDQS